MIALGTFQEPVSKALAEMKEQRIISRIWSRDHTVWKPEPEEITNRLGWLHIAETMKEQVERLSRLAAALVSEGYTHVLVLGMGGSSLAPEVFGKTFRDLPAEANRPQRALRLTVLDSTDPGAVLSAAERHNLHRTFFLVSTKSGGTVETLSFFKFFYNRVAGTVGTERVGEHFGAVTDPGSRLADIARTHNFREIFLNDPDIGGRYSALSHFGLVPAALAGVDLDRLLDRALGAAGNAGSSNGGEHHAALLGVTMAELARTGRDKVTLIISPAISSFGDWVEQLIAESTGKEGKGILPVVGEPVGPPGVYADDRLFVHLRLEGDDTFTGAVRALEEAGHPVVRLQLNDLYDLGEQFFLWEMATVVAGYRLGINPFDQPNVEAAKVLARDMVADYRKEGRLPELTPAVQDGGIAVYGEVGGGSPEEALAAFLAGAEPGAYLALQAYVQPTPENDAALLALRARLRDRSRLATTLGYGPRFLHSTGQLHKGDAGRGLFIQFTADDPRDAGIPDQAEESYSSMSFGVLKRAQTLGDRQALLDAGRRVIRFHLGQDVAGGLRRLTEARE